MSRPTDGRNVLVTGTTGSGKTAWTMQQVGSARRLLVWDALGEWSQRGLVAAVPSLRQLGERVVADVGKRGAFALGYTGQVTKPGFETFCQLAWVWLRAGHGSVLVVEELADVTTPGRAPPSWGEICRKGRHVGASVYAITQRPAESDKTILANAAAVHCGRMAYPRDRAYMADVLDVPQSDITALAPLEWIERDMRTLKLQRGRVTFENRNSQRGRSGAGSTRR